ncbi:MAG: 16S rRNA (cytosine(1402)-N(4))-methyltransferase RsmH [Kiritimatiellia bacterium]
MDRSVHQAVLSREVAAALAVRPGGVYLDGTLGGGGHARAILEAARPGGRLIGIDRDADALARCRGVLTAPDAAVELIQGNFRYMAVLAQKAGVAAFDGILLDLGISSDQLETPERGFSFMSEGPLDMRLDASGGTTAADLLNTLSEQELADLFWRYGEETDSRRIARAVVADRRTALFRGTLFFAEWVARIKGGRKGRIHPATQVFQALRVAVNDELGAADEGVEAAIRLLKPGGRLAVITFHSLEDRVVKRIFQRHAGKWENLQAGGRRWDGDEPRVRWVDKKPVTASEEELERNPRARSAKLRTVERVEEVPA